MPFRFIVFILATTALLPGATLRLSPQAAAAHASSHHPHLAIARLQIEEARGRRDAAGRLPNPDVEFTFSQNPRSPERNFDLSWTQRFPITGRLRLEKAISLAELAEAEAEYQDAKRKIAGETHAMALNLVALEMERTLRDRQIQNSEELSAYMEKRAQSGEATQVDAALVKLETQQLRTQSLQQDAEKKRLLSALRLMLGLRPNDSLEITGRLENPIMRGQRKADPEIRGDYRAAQASAEAARERVNLARANRWQDIAISLNAQHTREEDVPHGFQRDTMLGFRLSVPLPVWDKNEGQIREAQAASKRAENEVALFDAKIQTEAATAHAEMIAAAKIVAEIDTALIPSAKKIEEQLHTAYAAGQAPLAEVIRARGRRFEIEAHRLAALRDWHLAHAKYQTAIGGLP